MSAHVLVLSEADTARFGFRVARGRLETDEDLSDSLIDEICEHRYDIEILRVPAGAQRTLQGMMRHGMTPIHADTLVYYEISLPRQLNIPQDDAGVRYELATANDTQQIAGVAARGFSQYRNHYHANPLLEPNAVLAGYVQWATSSLTHQNGNRVVYVAKSDNEVLGFISCQLTQELGVCEVILNAVSPACEGRGIYTQGLANVMSMVSQAGYRRLIISTQVWNYRVQQIWVRLGMSLYRAYDTYHFNNIGGLSRYSGKLASHRAGLMP